MAGWTAFPGAMTLGTIFLEGFGEFSPHPNLAGQAAEEGALWSVFMHAGELMRWSRSFSHTDADPPDTGLWWLEEAELSMDEASRIGFAQVGVDQNVHVAPLLVPLCQCFDESLRRLGEVNLRALQFNAKRLLPDRRPGGRLFIPQLGWFRMSQGPRANAFIAFDDGFLKGRNEAEFTEAVEGWNGIGAFEFGQIVPGLPSIQSRTESPGQPTPLFRLPSGASPWICPIGHRAAPR